MARLLISLLIATCASVGMASGKITLQNNFPDGGKQWRPMVGLSVYETVYKQMGLNFWSGYGQQFEGDGQKDVNWWVTKAQVDFFVGKFTIAPGVQFRALTSPDYRNETVGFVKLDYKLW